jgi:hypothetical protein
MDQSKMFVFSALCVILGLLFRLQQYAIRGPRSPLAIVDETTGALVTPRDTGSQGPHSEDRLLRTRSLYTRAQLSQYRTNALMELKKT